jgi:LacI family transcriptional regulator
MLRMDAEKKITIHDVAKQAGVSISSVSRVLSNHPYVSSTLRQRVERAVQDLGYHPDFLAHSLRSGSTRSVGFMVGTISNPIMADISLSISNVLTAHGYAMLLVCTQNQPELDLAYLRFLAHRQVSGLIISSAADGPDQTGPLITQLEVPTVMLDRQRPAGKHVNAVVSDHTSGMQAAVAHLISQGHRRIALIGGAPHFDPARARRAGFDAALQAANLAADPALIRMIGMNKQVGYEETQRLLVLPAPPTALIAGGNLILAGVLQALQERQIVVGRDLALIGCDDTELTRLYTPSITVIGRNLALLGEVAANLLLDTMKQGGGQTIVLPTQLVIRQSSCCGPVLPAK